MAKNGSSCMIVIDGSKRLPQQAAGLVPNRMRRRATPRLRGQLLMQYEKISDNNDRDGGERQQLLATETAVVTQRRPRRQEPRTKGR